MRPTKFLSWPATLVLFLGAATAIPPRLQGRQENGIASQTVDSPSATPSPSVKDKVSSVSSILSKTPSPSATVSVNDDTSSQISQSLSASAASTGDGPTNPTETVAAPSAINSSVSPDDSKLSDNVGSCIATDKSVQSHWQRTPDPSSHHSRNWSGWCCDVNKWTCIRSYWNQGNLVRSKVKKRQDHWLITRQALCILLHSLPSEPGCHSAYLIVLGIAVISLTDVLIGFDCIRHAPDSQRCHPRCFLCGYSVEWHSFRRPVTALQ
jgi:hypothetical protein